MKKMVLMIFFAFLLFGMFLHAPLVIADSHDTSNSGSGSSEDSVSVDADSCKIFSDAKFRSVDKYENGLGIDGEVIMGYWGLTFSDSEVEWRYSDIIEVGSFTCGRGTIKADLNGRIIEGKIDEQLEILEWNGVKYKILNNDSDSDRDNSGPGNADDSSDDENERTDRQPDRARERIRSEIHISGTDDAELRAAIQSRNRIHFNSTDLPENCEKTGSVIRCNLEERLKTKIEVEADFDLGNETKSLIRELSASLNDNAGEVKIEVEAEKEDGEVETEVKVEGTLSAEQQVLLSDLESSLQSLLESLERDELEVKIKIEHELRAARVMIVEAGNSGNTIVKFGDSEVRTRVELYHHNGEVYGRFGDNETRLIDILPDELQESIRERMRLRLEIRNDTVELNQEGEYEFEANKEARFLGVFKVREKTRFHVDPETGEILNVNAPWWGFLAADSDLEVDSEAEAETDNTVSNTQPVLGEEGEGVEEMIVNETNETA